MAKRTVLICDDAKIMRAVIRKLLEESGYFEIVGEVGDGVQVVAEFKRLKPSLVVLDLNLPIRDGNAAAKEILQEDPHANILLTTTKGQKSKVDALHSLGIVHACFKPIDNYEFVRTAMKACGIE